MEFESFESGDFEIIERHEASLGPDEVAKIQNWLQPTQYLAEFSEFRRHLASQAPGTAHWVCDTPKFQQWKDSEDHGSLWIKGVPGAGKSVIAASLVEQLRTASEIPVLFFFFRYIIAANRRPRNLIRDWIAQLLPYSSRLQAILEPISGDDLENFSDEKLWGHLLSGLSSVEKAYCIVDALDEMELDNDNAFLRRLNSFAVFRPKSVKLLMTSRPKEYLQSSLRDASIVHISLESDLVGKDIAVFVSHRLRNVLTDIDQMDLRDSIASTISTRSRGLFLYARLLLDQLTPRLSSMQLSDVKTLATTLPVGLEEMYNSMLFQQSQFLQIPEHSQLGIAIQVFLLECVSHSSRPLRLNELATVLNTVFMPSLLNMNVTSLPQWNSKQVTRNACAPLLEILEDGTIQVIHHSFTEFLLDSERAKSARGVQAQFPVLDPSTIHKNLATTCLKYLQSGCLGHRNIELKYVQKCDAECDHGDWPCPRRPVEADPYDYQQALLSYPFLQYAVTNWAWHTSHYDVEDRGFFNLVSEFLDSNNPNFQRWLILQWGAKYPVTEAQIPSSLHVAAFAGMTKYASSLLLQGQRVDSLDANERTPLYWAATRGHTEIVLLLLRNGANPDPADRQGIKPLHAASRNNHAPIVRVLLQSGVDPLTPKTQENHRGRIKGGERMTKGETAVEYVCELGHTESIVAMLPHLKGETLEEVLCSCCRFGYVEAARAVLESSNVSPNARFEGATALYLATVYAKAECVEMLLAKRADPNLVSDWEPRPFHRRGRMQKEGPMLPIHRLAMSWRSSKPAYQSIFRSLLKAGADLEAKARFGESPLLLLFGTRGGLGGDSCYLPAVKSFLEAGCNIAAVGEGNSFQGTDASRGILQRLLEGDRNLDVFNLLLDNGADIQVRDKEGNNALHMALGRSTTHKPGTVDVLVNTLLEKGVQANIKNKRGQTPLELAVQMPDCSMQTCKRLLRSCLDSEARDRCLSLVGPRPREEKIEFIQELQRAGASLESRDKFGATPLLANTRSQGLFKILLDCGANLNAEDNQGRGVLHYYVQGGHSAEGLQTFIQLGLDPKKADKKGDTLLHIAVEYYDGTKSRVELVQQLLDFGISPNSKNRLGSTPAHVHIKYSQIRSSTNERRRVPLLEILQKSTDFDINTQDNEGLTLLHLAVLRSEIEVAQILAAGADSSILNNEGRSALHLACRARKSNNVGLLVSKLGQELIDKADLSQRTALHDACTSGRPESVYCLLRIGANVNFKDSNGRTPLHACAESSLEQSLWLLQDCRNSVYGQGPPDQYRPAVVTNMNPWYASKYCTQPTFSEHDTVRIGSIVTALLVAGTDINALDRSGRTPLDLSLILGCFEMTAALQSAHTKIQKSLQMEERETKLQIELALRQKSSIIGPGSSDSAMRDVIENPSKYLSRLTTSDIDSIVTYHENNTAALFYDEANLLQKAAKYGLTEIVERLGTRALCYDKAPFPQPLEEDVLVKSPLPPASAESSQDIIPIMQAACRSTFPNLKMLETLVEKCGVDVNARSREYPEPYSRSRSVGNYAQSTALHCLASADYFWQLDGIRFLIRHGGDVNARNENGETALHIASTGPNQDIMGHSHSFWKPSCVKVLLDLGADPNVLSNDGLTPLHKAGSSVEIMRSLLQGGADLSVGKTSPLFFAIKEQNLEALRAILDAGGDPNAVTEPFSIAPSITDQARTALFCACFAVGLNRQISESVPLIKLLIDSGADVNAPLNDRETLIHYVFEHGEYKAVCAFLDRHDKIDFNATDQFGKNVLLAACNGIGVAPGYLKHKVKSTGEPFPIIRLLDYGANILARSKDGRNALHHLMDNPDIEQDAILEFLDREPEACKIMMNQKDKQGFDPFHSALRMLRPEICFKLMDMGANLLDPDPSGATALHHIARQYLEDYVPSRKVFCLNTCSRDSKTILKLWNKFFDLGGSINICDNAGSPPLFYYLSSPPREDSRDSSESCCHVDSFVKLFDTEDLDINIRNNEGESALHIIARRAKTYYTKQSHEGQLFNFFLKGLDPLSEDKNARTALDVAAATGKTDILELFKRS